MTAMNPIASFPVPNLDPSNLLRVRDSIYASDLLIAAVGWMDFFTWLQTHPSDKTGICTSLGLIDRPADVMLTLFTAMGLLRQQNGVFEVTELAANYLVKGADWDLRPYFSSLKERPISKDLLEILKTGKMFSWGSEQTEEDWAKAMEKPGFAQSFTAGMDSRGACMAPVVAEKLDCLRYKNLLDIAGGSGIYACAIAALHPHLRATVFEKPPVDQITRYAIEKKGLAERVSVVGGDMFDGLPVGFDMHLFSNVIHDWDVPAVQRLLNQSYESLESGGMIVIHDAHINADKTGDLAIAEYSVLLMYACEGKCYSIREMEEYLLQAGFVDVVYTPTIANRSLITARKR